MDKISKYLYFHPALHPCFICLILIPAPFSVQFYLQNLKPASGLYFVDLIFLKFCTRIVFTLITEFGGKLP